ncbi:MAG TPA: hypothetical protein PKI14_12160 [Fervidobacterium sp.]|nr:hypothetical protein [Fervidobacterium sp.]
MNYEFLDKKELNEYIEFVQSEGDFVGFIGGSPCPDFSIWVKNRG